MEPRVLAASSFLHVLSFVCVLLILSSRTRDVFQYNRTLEYWRPSNPSSVSLTSMLKIISLGQNRLWVTLEPVFPKEFPNNGELRLLAPQVWLVDWKTANNSELEFFERRKQALHPRLNIACDFVGYIGGIVESAGGRELFGGWVRQGKVWGDFCGVGLYEVKPTILSAYLVPGAVMSEHGKGHHASLGPRSD